MNYGRSIVSSNNGPERCEQVRAAIVDEIVGRAGVGDGADIESHLATCEACRSYRAGWGTLWADLARTAVPAPRTDARARLMRAAQSALGSTTSRIDRPSRRRRA